MAKNNPVIEEYKGVKIRRFNSVEFKFGIVQYKKILDEVESTGLSIHKLIAHSSQPCDKCKGSDVVFYDKNDNLCKVKRGILSIPESNGISIIQNARDKKEGKRKG